MNKFVASAVLFFGAASGANGAVIYAPTPIGSSARVSDYGQTSGSGFRTFDNFMAPAGASVERVAWRGFWLDFSMPVPAPAPIPDVLTWDLAFYEDAGGAPGAPLLLQSFAAVAVTSTDVGNDVFSAGSSYNVSFYDYSVELPIPFAAAAGIQYWFSVLSRSEHYNPAFVLRGASGGSSPGRATHCRHAGRTRATLGRPALPEHRRGRYSVSASETIT